MRRKVDMIMGGAPCGALLVTALLLLLPGAHADEPMLAIRVVGGGDAVYAVSEIERLGFEGGDTLVVVTATGTASYAPETIRRIEFLWDFSAVEDPAEEARLVRTLVSGERPAGRQEVRWDGLDEAGRKSPGGVYFYNLKAPGVTDSRRMILLP